MSLRMATISDDVARTGLFTGESDLEDAAQQPGKRSILDLPVIRDESRRGACAVAEWEIEKLCVQFQGR